MREFKFRVWDLEKKFYLNQDDEFHFYEPDRGWQCPIPLCECLRDKKRYVVQQYTGLNDKNDKEIYDGDILIECIDNRTKLGICKQILGGWKIFTHSNSSICWNGCKDEVIGNIFEHSELLK